MLTQATIGDDDFRLLQNFTAQLLTQGEDAPDEEALQAVSDQGLRSFAVAVAETLGKPTPEVSQSPRVDLMKYIRPLTVEMLGRVQKEHRLEAPAHHLADIPPKRLQNEVPDNGVHVQYSRNKDNGLDALASSRITRGVMRDLRKANGWVAAYPWGRQFGISSTQSKSFMDQLIQQKTKTLLEQSCDPAAAAAKIYAEYIAIDDVKSYAAEKQFHRYKAYYCQLSPQAQTDFIDLYRKVYPGQLSITEEGKIKIAFSRKEALRNKDWKAMEFISNRWGISHRHNQSTLTEIISALCEQKITALIEESEGLTRSDAETLVNRTYLCRQEIHDPVSGELKQTRWAFSPLALRDMDAKIRETFPDHAPKEDYPQYRLPPLEPEDRSMDRR